MNQEYKRKRRLSAYKKMRSAYVQAMKLESLDSHNVSLSLEYSAANYGLCSVLSDINRRAFHQHDIKESYPELWAQKPSHCYDSAWWWKHGSMEPRLKAIDRAILMIEPDYKFATN